MSNPVPHSPALPSLTDETPHEQFKRLDGLRLSRLQASETFAYYTIPSVFPREDTGDDTTGVGMLDAIGASVANHFANKVVTTMFSPNKPFFRMIPDPNSKDAQKLKQLQEEAEDVDKEQVAAIISKFRTKASRIEKDAVQHLESIGHRTAATNLAKLLIITGDGVIKYNGDRKPTVYTMRDYVCIKDAAGDDKVLIIRDAMSFAQLPTATKERLFESMSEKPVATTQITVYTRYALDDDGRYTIDQGTDSVDSLTQGELKKVTKDDMVHTHLSWNLTRGENYGRGLVEDYAGSFHMIDAMSRTVAMLVARLASQKILVDPKSMVDVVALNSANSDTYVSGTPDAIGTEKIVDPNDVIMLEQSIAGHKRQISNAFLFGTGTVRDAERVTAEEIRENAAELELAHGGVYSRFASDWQSKTARQAVAAVSTPMGDAVAPQIITGMDSLSRHGEMQSVRIWLQDLSMLNSVPEDTRGVIKQAEFADYAAVQRGVEKGAFVKTPQEIEAEIKAEQERQLALQQQEAAQQSAQATIQGA